MGKNMLFNVFLWFGITLLQTGLPLKVRLRGGTNSSIEGRVEVLYNREWGTICDDHWTADNANVVCRMVGFRRAFITKKFGPGSGQIWLDNVWCKGYETSIDSCYHGGWGNNDCKHNEDVGVVCTNDDNPDIGIRLRTGNLPNAGQVEIRYYGTWKPVCDGYWSLQDAHVVCRMMNYTNGAALAIRGYQTSAGDAWDTWINCRGSEASIDKCRMFYWGQSNCTNRFRASVVCLNPGQYPNIAVRLVNGSSPNQGRVEVRYHGIWGTVCDDYWGIGNAHVVCHMLNYSKALFTWKARNGGSGPILLDDVHCSGFEKSLASCWNRGWGQHNCDHSEDIEVICENGTKVDPEVSARLSNGSLSYAGQVEIRYYGTWKPICDEYWTLRDAHVVCRMMNYTNGAALAIRGYQTSAGDAWDTWINCRGNEASIDKCRMFYWGQKSCLDFKAGVVCKNPGQRPNVSVRLVNGSLPNQGRLEVRYYGIWGTVCDDYWGLENAHVVCRMLNYSKALWTGTAKNKGSGPILLDDVFCSGYENTLEYCWNIGWGQHNCFHSEDVSVTCENETKVQTKDLAVRIVNSSTPNQGRVEVRYYGIWGTVCDDGWGLEDGHVVCRMLNYSKASWAGTTKARGSGPIALDEVQCRGNEKSIDDCPKNGVGWHDCSHYEDAGVKCEMLSKEELNVTARLVGAEHNYLGYVEVKYNDTWRPVCDDTWDISDSHVICRMLGYESALLGIKGSRTGKIGLWLGGVECNGRESSISECYHRGWSNTWCPGNLYAGVMCNVTNEFPPVQVRLEEGSLPNSGRVAVRYGNLWGTICKKELDFNDVKVFCHMLGYPRALYTYSFRPGKGAIWLMSLECNGKEKSLVDCPHGWGKSVTCSHDHDVAIMCKKADAPRFQIKESSAIRDSTVEIVFKAPQTNETQLESFYQVAVEKRDIIKYYKSNRQTLPYAFDQNAAMTTGNHSYIAAEVPSSISSLVIGDGKYYHGYYNAPLKPGCNYRIYVRSFINTADKKPIYSDTVFVTFTTKQEPITNKVTSVKQLSSAHLRDAVICLSVVIVLLIFLITGYYVWFILRKKNANQKEKQTETAPGPGISGMEDATEIEPSGSHYQRLCHPSVQQQSSGNKQNQLSRILNKMSRKPTPEKPRLTFAEEQGITGFENQAYQVADITMQELNFSQTEDEG